MTAPTKKIWHAIGLNALGGVLSYPIAYGLVFAIGSFYPMPGTIATVIFVSTYSGLVMIFIYRIWDDVRTFTDDVRILIILNENNTIPASESNIPQAAAYQKLYDEETYEAFQRLLCGFPPEYTVIKLNRLFFLKDITILPSLKLQEMVNDQKAFAQVLARLKTEDCVRTDGYFFSIQLGKWETKRDELIADKPELQKWQDVANLLIEAGKS